ncbi:MAG: penicillin-binding protein 2, partial [Pygmaiobacter sp.]
MTCKRLLSLIILFMMLFVTVQLRIFALMLNPAAPQAAHAQSTVTLPLAQGRANFYDCAMQPLTGTNTEQLALALPGDFS